MPNRTGGGAFGNREKINERVKQIFRYDRIEHMPLQSRHSPPPEHPPTGLRLFPKRGIFRHSLLLATGMLVWRHLVDGEMRLNAFGQVVEALWRGLPDHFSGIKLDEFVIMPNHFHGIIEITKFVGAKQGSSALPDLSALPHSEIQTKPDEADGNIYFPTAWHDIRFITCDHSEFQSDINA